MKRFSALILAMMMASITFLTGCEEEIIDNPQNEQPASYLKLIKAYEEGRVFYAVESVSDTKNIVRFADGHAVEVPVDDFKINDCRESAPPSITPNGSWWQVGAMTVAVKVETALTNQNASPVYVCT